MSSKTDFPSAFAGAAKNQSSVEERWNSLSGLEKRIALHIARGDSNAQISVAVGMHTRALKTHIHHLYSVIGADGPAGLMRFISNAPLSESEREYLSPLDTASLCVLDRSETEIAECIASGYTSRETSSELRMTQRDIRESLKAIFAKTGAENEEQLAALVIKNHVRLKTESAPGAQIA